MHKQKDINEIGKSTLWLSVPFSVFSLVILTLASLLSLTTRAQIYNPTWTSQSKNSSQSMPLCGGDIGLNVWVENNDILFYIARSGTFDENNSLLKLGRVRLQLNPNPFEGGANFKQELHLNEGYISI